MGACNGSFSYSASSTQTLRLYVWLNNYEFKVVDAKYNFSNGTWGSSSDVNNSNISVSTNRYSPSTNEYVNITVKTNSSYTDYVYFSLEYYDGYTRRTASSSDYSVDNYFNNGYRFSYSDYGERTFNSFIKFYRNAQYRLYVRDYSGNRNYVEFNVGGGSSTSNISLSTNKSYPNTNERVNTTVNVDSSYRGKITFYVQYRSSSSYSRSTVSSSSYFSANSYLNNGYRFNSSDYGSKTFSDFISFKEKGYYRLYARDDTGKENYVEFNVSGGGSYDSNLSVSTNRSSPSTNEYVNISIRTTSSYTDYVYFSLEYYDGYTRRTASSSDYSVDNYFNNGYRFSYSDYGERTFNSFIKFYRNAQYRLYVRDYSGNRNYVEFNVGGGGSSNNNPSKVNGFTVSELNKITKIYQLRNNLLSQLQNQSRNLRNDSYRQRLSNTLYQNMRDVVNNKSNREFYYRSNFLSAFLQRFEYTYKNA
ncbi:MAG: hypothetical protein LBG52_02750 [Candidatus Peribacteria bacterium]|nr:hypothetical protein [Candidatus Peribacteria bacterium]